MGCKKAGASRIIGVDINADKFETGMMLILSFLITELKLIVDVRY